jgi:hypothetical protein
MRAPTGVQGQLQAQQRLLEPASLSKARNVVTKSARVAADGSVATAEAALASTLLHV